MLTRVSIVEVRCWAARIAALWKGRAAQATIGVVSRSCHHGPPDGCHGPMAKRSTDRARPPAIAARMARSERLEINVLVAGVTGTRQPDAWTAPMRSATVVGAEKLTCARSVARLTLMATPSILPTLAFDPRHAGRAGHPGDREVNLVGRGLVMCPRGRSRCSRLHRRPPRWPSARGPRRARAPPARRHPRRGRPDLRDPRHGEQLLGDVFDAVAAGHPGNDDRGLVHGTSLRGE